MFVHSHGRIAQRRVRNRKVCSVRLGVDERLVKTVNVGVYSNDGVFAAIVVAEVARASIDGVSGIVHERDTGTNSEFEVTEISCVLKGCFGTESVIAKRIDATLCVSVNLRQNRKYGGAILNE